jgi:hypothetical protein
MGLIHISLDAFCITLHDNPFLKGLSEFYQKLLIREDAYVSVCLYCVL